MGCHRDARYVADRINALVGENEIYNSGLELQTVKRSVAIVGPTPSFVRWAIRHECPLRQIDDENLADSTFRQLRGLRELSVARNEARIIEGVCFHREQTQDAETVLGFFADEISDFYGGVENVSSCCGACPANAVQLATEVEQVQQVWGGCYGWFPSQSDGHDFVREFENVSEENIPFNWYQVWQTSVWQSDELQRLQKILEQIPATIENVALAELSAAVTACVAHKFSLVTELVPGGNSDGLHWTINSHCPDCKFEMSETQKDCPACKRNGVPNRMVKRKVLGLRPYVKLSRLMGDDATSELLARYLDFKTNKQKETGT